MDWDDLRFVLAVVRAGSALGAAKALSVNQTTVTRRVEKMEEQLGAPLFERGTGGLTPTALGSRAAETAERMEADVAAFQSQAESEQRALSGVVRITASETMANGLIGPVLYQFRKQHPNVRVELIIADRKLDLAKGEADVAVRAGSRPEGAGIVMRRLPDTGWGVYCSREYAADRGSPTRREDVPGHDIIGMEGPMSRLPGPAWLEASAPQTEIRFRSNSLTNLVSSLRAGLGLGTLPCFVGDQHLDLMRCFGPIKELQSETWLVVREDAKATPHIRAFADTVHDYVMSQRERLLGVTA